MKDLPLEKAKEFLLKINDGDIKIPWHDTVVFYWDNARYRVLGIGLDDEERLNYIIERIYHLLWDRCK